MFLEGEIRVEQHTQASDSQFHMNGSTGGLDAWGQLVETNDDNFCFNVSFKKQLTDCVKTVCKV